MSDPQTAPRMETLEQRLLLSIAGPLSVNGPFSGTFTDSNGDVITVEVTGTSGSVSFVDTNSSPGVADGRDIVTVNITGASKDFAIRFADDDSGGVGGGDIFLGDIYSDKAIRGIFTVGGSDGSSAFELASYDGALAPGGRIQVTDIYGAGLFLPGLAAGAEIDVANDLDASVVQINGNLSGAINVLDDWEATLTVNGSVTATGLITVGDNFDGNVDISGSFLGTTKIGDSAGGYWTIDGIVGVKAVLQAGGWFDLTTGRIDGKVLANEDNIDLLTVNGSITKKGLVAADEDIDLDVYGNVAAGAKIISYDGELFADVYGIANGSWTAGGDALTVDANSFAGGKYVGGSVNLTSNAGFSKIIVDSGSVSLNGPGALVNSTVEGFGESLDVTVGSVKNSTLGGYDVTVNLAGGMSGVKMEAFGVMDVTVGGDLSCSSLVAADSVLLSVGGNFIKSSLETGSDFDVSVEGSVTDGTLAGNDSSSLTTGRMTGGIVTVGSDLTTNIYGDVAKSHWVVYGDLYGEVYGQMIKSVVAVSGSIGISMAPPEDGGEEDVLLLPEAFDSIPAFFIDEGIVCSAITSIDMTLEVLSGGVSKSSLAAGGFAMIEITGDVVKSTLGGANGLDLAVYGDFVSGQAYGANMDELDEEYAVDAYVSGDVGKGVLIEVALDDDLYLDVDGSFAGKVSGGADGDIYIYEDMTATAAVVFDDDVILVVEGDLNGKVDAGDLDLEVDGSVGSKAVLTVAQSVNDLNSDDQGFWVGGSFAGKLAVVGDFDTGLASETWEIIGGDVLKTALITIGGTPSGAGTLEFGGDFAGQLTIGTMGSNLQFDGDAGGITIIGRQSGTIDVAGALDGLSTGSTFVMTGGLTGNFLDGDGNVVGTLTTGAGWANVQPISYTI
jgi:hypothetical protein